MSRNTNNIYWNDIHIVCASIVLTLSPAEACPPPIKHIPVHFPNPLLKALHDHKVLILKNLFPQYGEF